MNAFDPVSWLYGLQRSGVKLGLQGIRDLLALLGHPERAVPSVLVAGTNGKGSTAATLDALLAAHGVRTGLYTSPHLVRPNERVRIAGEDLDDRALHALLRELRGRIADGLRDGALETLPSFFEVMTALALEAFCRQRVEVAVLEVGLGGRLDATNAVEAALSVIVGVDLDHTGTLGSTLAAIAREKAGIVKRGRPLVSGVLQVEAREVVLAACQAASAPFHDAAEKTSAHRAADGSVTVATPTAAYAGLRPALGGRHQLHNLRIALRSFEVLAEILGFQVEPPRVRDGLAAVRWPGRLQRIPGDPPLLLDGAHNAAGALALAEVLGDRQEPPPVLLLGAMRDKDLPAILAPLAARAQAIVLTRSRVPRAAEPEALAAALPPGPPGLEVVLEPDLPRALERARTLARREGTDVLVSGSLYLVGDVLGLLEGVPVPGPVPM